MPIYKADADMLAQITRIADSASSQYVNETALKSTTDSLYAAVDQLEAINVSVHVSVDTLENGQASLLAALVLANAADPSLLAAVDGLEGITSSIYAGLGGTTDSIYAAVDAVEAGQASLLAAVDTLEAGQASLLAAIDTLEAGQASLLAAVDGLEGASSSIWFIGRRESASSLRTYLGAVQGTATTLFNLNLGTVGVRLQVRNPSAAESGVTVWLGSLTLAPSLGVGYPILPGETIEFLDGSCSYLFGICATAVSGAPMYAAWEQAVVA